MRSSCCRRRCRCVVKSVSQASAASATAATSVTEPATTTTATTAATTTAAVTGRIAQWTEHRLRDRKVSGTSPGRSGGTVFLLQGQLSALTLISVSIPRPWKFSVILPKVQMAARLRSNRRASYMWCMVVWCTQNAPRRQQFHVALTM